MKKIDSTGKLVISLDFELLYGMNDQTKRERWERNARGAREAIPQILQMFEEYGIHATWGIVGMLYAKDKATWERMLPNRIPQYDNARFSNYQQANPGADEKQDPFHYAPSLIQKIRETRGQEIGSHTFSHYYCMEQGQTKEDFASDVEATLQVEPKVYSFIFPKNQFQSQYLSILNQNGIIAVRGNEKGFMYEASKAGESLFKRGMRLADSFFNLSGYHCYDIAKLEVTDGVVDIPSSRFLRPFSQRLRCLEGMKLRRIKGQMRYAAKKGQVFHLWWHPHNFGSNTAENMHNLKKILDYYQKMEKKYGMQSCTMKEIAEYRKQYENKDK